MTDKTTRWQMTVYEGQYGQLAKMPPGIAEWGWQDEVCPDTGRAHRQGYFRTSTQQRLSGAIKMLPGIHIEPARNWEATVNYCKKPETRAPGAVHVHQVNDIPNKFMYADEIADRLAKMTLIPHQKVTRDDVDYLVTMDIASGRRGIMWIGCDPNWTTMWNKYFEPMLKAAVSRQTDRQTETKNPPAEYTNEARSEGTGTQGGEEGGPQGPREDEC
nr:MAG: replication associated protein [Cressdnaviricota sp.]